MDTIAALFNIVLVAYIDATMPSAEFNTTFDQLTDVLRKWQLDTKVFPVGSIAFALTMPGGPAPGRARRKGPVCAI